MVEGAMGVGVSAAFVHEYPTSEYQHLDLWGSAGRGYGHLAFCDSNIP